MMMIFFTLRLASGSKEHHSIDEETWSSGGGPTDLGLDVVVWLSASNTFLACFFV